MPDLNVVTEKIKIRKKPKHLSQPEFDVKIAIEIPEMRKELKDKYLSKFNRKFRGEYKKFRDKWLDDYNAGIASLDTSIGDRLKEKDKICARLTQKLTVSASKSLKSTIETFDTKCRELQNVMDSYQPTLRNGVATFRSQVEAMATKCQKEVEAELKKEGLSQKSAAKRSTNIKIAIGVGVVLVGVAVAIAVVATGGLAGVALGVAAAALAVSCLSGVCTIVKTFKTHRSAMKAEAAKVNEHLGKIERAAHAVRKHEAKQARKNLGLKTSSKSSGGNDHWKTCLASASKLKKHATRLDQIAFGVQIELRDKKKEVADMRSHARKALSDFKKNEATMKRAGMTNPQEKVSKDIIRNCDTIDKEFEKLESKVKDLTGLLSAVADLESELEKGAANKADPDGKRIERVSKHQKRLMRFIAYIPTIVGYMDSTSSAVSGSYTAYSQATA